MSPSVVIMAVVVVFAFEAALQILIFLIFGPGLRRSTRAADRRADRCCRKCGYRIDNLPGPCCPECGRRFIAPPDDFDPQTMFSDHRRSGRAAALRDECSGPAAEPRA